jgi:crotonobetainyl-CoA hydratase
LNINKRNHMNQSVICEVFDEVLLITLDRPKANAIDAKTSHELGDAFIAFRAVDADFGPGGFAGLTELWDLDKPVIAAVNGMAVGGGFELALAADLIIASDNAAFFVPEATLGIIPDSGGVLRLPRRLPKAIAMDLLMTGRRMGLDEAMQYGLVNKRTSLQDLKSEAIEWAHEITQSAPLALASIKAVIRETEDLKIEDGYKLMRSGKIGVYQQMLRSEDAGEGPLAFSEKRTPQWKGR